MSRTNLHLVPQQPEPSEAEAELSRLVPELMRAEMRVAELRNLVGVQRRRLAIKRGVAFVREEHVRREFGR